MFEGYTDFSEAIFDETTNFEGTIFEGYNPEEIKLWCKELNEWGEYLGGNKK
jgi:hypothetical protein